MSTESKRNISTWTSNLKSEFALTHVINYKIKCESSNLTEQV